LVKNLNQATELNLDIAASSPGYKPDHSCFAGILRRAASWLTAQPCYGVNTVFNRIS